MSEPSTSISRLAAALVYRHDRAPQGEPRRPAGTHRARAQGAAVMTKLPCRRHLCDIPEDGPAYGAALLGAVGAGAFPDLATAAQRTLGRSPPLEPDASVHQEYERLYERFRRCCETLILPHARSSIPP